MQYLSTSYQGFFTLNIIAKIPALLLPNSIMMFQMKNTLRIFILGLLFTGSSQELSAQFYQVYAYMTPDAKEKELVYWTTYIPSSDHRYSFFGQYGQFRWQAEVSKF
jgi:hypothetical protein